MVLRASTDNTLDDLERAVDDGVNAYRVGLALISVTSWNLQITGSNEPQEMVLELVCSSPPPPPFPHQYLALAAFIAILHLLLLQSDDAVPHSLVTHTAAETVLCYAGLQQLHAHIGFSAL